MAQQKLCYGLYQLIVHVLRTILEDRSLALARLFGPLAPSRTLLTLLTSALGPVVRFL